MIASHGSREMPVWGPIFHQVEEDVDRGNVRVENLVTYLESIQTVHSRVHATTPIMGLRHHHSRMCRPT
jgi:folate-dependent phosphoribosylglycinamide formyltransferase PurN